MSVGLCKFCLKVEPADAGQSNVKNEAGGSNTIGQAPLLQKIGSCTERLDAKLCRCCGFAAQPTLSGISPRTLYLFACRRTNNMIRSRPQASKGRNIRTTWGGHVILPVCLGVRSWWL